MIIEKCPKLGMGPPFDKNRCVIKFMSLCSIMLVRVYPIVSVGRLATWVLFAVLHPHWAETDVCDQISQIHSVCFLLLPTCVYTVLMRVLLFSCCKMDCGAENIKADILRCSSWWTQPIGVIHSPVSRLIALQRAFVYLWFSGQNKLMSITVITFK